MIFAISDKNAAEEYKRNDYSAELFAESDKKHRSEKINNNSVAYDFNHAYVCAYVYVVVSHNKKKRKTHLYVKFCKILQLFY